MLPVPQFLVGEDMFEQQYPLCMKVGSGGNLGLGREYHKKTILAYVLFMVELSFK